MITPTLIRGGKSCAAAMGDIPDMTVAAAKRQKVLIEIDRSIFSLLFAGIGDPAFLHPGNFQAGGLGTTLI